MKKKKDKEVQRLDIIQYLKKKYGKDILKKQIQEDIEMIWTLIGVGLLVIGTFVLCKNPFQVGKIIWLQPLAL